MPSAISASFRTRTCATSSASAADRQRTLKRKSIQLSRSPVNVASRSLKKLSELAAALDFSARPACFPEAPDPSQRLENDPAIHLGFADLAVFKDDGKLGDLEAPQKRAVLELDLKRVAVRSQRWQIHRLDNADASR